MAVGPEDSDHNATDVFLDGFQYWFYGFFYVLKLVINYSICTKTYTYLILITETNWYYVLKGHLHTFPIINFNSFSAGSESCYKTHKFGFKTV